METPSPGRSPGPVLAVLGYHKIGPAPESGWRTWFYIPQRTFIAQLRYLRDNGWHVIDRTAFLRGLRVPETLPARAALLTFDDGCRQLLDVALPVLRDFGYPSIHFVPTAFIGGCNGFEGDREPVEPIFTWADLRRLARSGLAVQSHGVSHLSFSDLSPAGLRREITQSKMDLERRLKTSVDLFAYASGDGGTKATEVAQAFKRSGYHAAFLYGGGLIRFPIADPYRLPRLAMGPDTDLPKLLSRLRPARAAEAMLS